MAAALNLDQNTVQTLLRETEFSPLDLGHAEGRINKMKMQGLSIAAMDVKD